MENKISLEERKKKAFIIASTLFFVYIAIVLFLCLVNFSNFSINLDTNKYFLGIRLDRFIHFLMFFPFPFVCWIYFRYNSNIKVYKNFKIAAIVLIGVIFAAGAEGAQELLTSYRDSDPYDLGANMTGIFLGSIILYLIRNWLNKIFDKIFHNIPAQDKYPQEFENF